MPNFGKSPKSKNKKKSWKLSVKREGNLPPVAYDETTGPDLINNLNNDCLIKMFQHLAIADKFHIGRVCKRWKDLSKFAWENMVTLSFEESDRGSDLYQLPVKSRTNKGVEKLLKRCGPYVEDLTLGSPCDCRIMPAVSEYCQNLKILQIHFDCHNWNSNTFFPYLQNVKFQYDIIRDRRISEKALQALPPKSLTEIDLYAVATPHYAFAHYPLPSLSTLPRTAATVFKNFTKLSKVTMTNFVLESPMVAAISEKSTLISLDLTSCFMKGGLSRLTLLTNLEDLDLTLVQQVNNNFLNELSKTCHNLKTLNLYGCSVTDQGISNFWQLSKLEELIMCEVESITDIHLGDLKNLKTLDCRGCKSVHDNGIITLMVNASNLQSLNVKDTAVTEKILGIANLITEERTNNLSLTIFVSGHVKRRWNKGRGEVSPLLIVGEKM